MLFHVSAFQHVIGSIIQPGRFGAQLRVFRPGGPFPQDPHFTELLIEIGLESARKSVAPHAPSRLDCVFACETLEDAERFRTAYRGGIGAIYGVRPEPEDAPTFRGNFSLISSHAGSQPYVDYVSEWAIDYWPADPAQMVEVLIGGPVYVETELFTL